MGVREQKCLENTALEASASMLEYLQKKKIYMVIAFYSGVTSRNLVCSYGSFPEECAEFNSNIKLPYCPDRGTAVAQWLRCCATNRKVAGSIPAGVSGFFIDIKSFRSHYGPGGPLSF